MSCFIVNPKTVAKIANYIAAQINGGYNCTHLSVDIPSGFVRSVVNESGFANPEKIYKSLYTLNYVAFCTRYEGRHQENLDRCEENIGNFAEYDTPIAGLFDHQIGAQHYQMLKSMHCFLYQCTEDSELEKFNSYIVVSRMIKALESAIIGRSPEYQAAEWS